MRIVYNVSGERRKQLVRAVSEILGIPAHYDGAPTFCYSVDYYTIDKNGTLSFSDRTDSDEVENLLEELDARGFECEPAEGYEEDDAEPCGAEAPSPEEDFTSRTYQAELSDPDCPDRMEVFKAAHDEDAIMEAYGFCEGGVELLELLELDDDCNVIRGVDLTSESSRLSITYPRIGFSQTALDNLTKMVAAKKTLIMAALGAEDLPIEVTEEVIRFPWFTLDDPSEAAYYSQFIWALCMTAQAKKRVTAKERAIDGSAKFAMRCFLLQLGLIGPEYRKARQHLLSKLGGSSAFKYGTPTKSADKEVEYE